MPNYPTSPVSKYKSGGYIFPSNLNLNGFNIQLQVGTYTRPTVFVAPNINYTGIVVLPIPIKINDVQTVTWEPASLTSLGLDVATSAASAVENKATGNAGLVNALGALAALTQATVGYTEGVTINPNLVMLFKTQNFKKHNLQWLLAPNSPEDSENLNNLIKFLKNAMLPTTIGSVSSLSSITSLVSSQLGNLLGSSNLSVGLGYPNIIQPILSVKDYTYTFKPCAIESLSVDFSAGSTPSFFGKNGAPALVSLSMQLTELELWFNGQVK